MSALALMRRPVATASHSKVLPAKEDVDILLSRPVSRHYRAELKPSSPSIGTLGERLMRSVHIGCSWYSRRCHLLVGLSFHRVVGGQERNRGTRSLVVVHSTFLNYASYAAASLRFAVLWSSKASLRDTAMIARFFPLLPPCLARFSHHCRRSESSPNGPRMCFAPCTSTMRR
jgi:hypothetical protein